jgi:hypothetical protein
MVVKQFSSNCAFRMRPYRKHPARSRCLECQAWNVPYCPQRSPILSDSEIAGLAPLPTFGNSCINVGCLRL